MRYCLILLVLILMQNVSATTVIWADNAHWPPWYFQDGPRKGQGISQRTIQYLMAQLEPLGYQSKLVEMTTPRMLEMMRPDDSIVCSSDLRRTPEREQVMVFSDQPSMFTLAIGVVHLSEKANQFAKHLDVNGKIPFAALIRDTHLRAGLEENRAYIKNHAPFVSTDPNYHLTQDSTHVYFRNNKDPARAFIKMILLHRIDYTLVDPYEFNVVIDELKMNEDDAKKVPSFDFIQISENKGFDLSFIGCSKNEAGTKFVAEISRILRASQFDAKYMDIFTQDLPSASSKESYLKSYKKYFASLFNQE
ncbi:MAG: hypothetical protein ACI9Y1_002201 [Lentisphaeria bacterium]|jgi:uncharacterized protein (TIGR02285 family)